MKQNVLDVNEKLANLRWFLKIFYVPKPSSLLAAKETKFLDTHGRGLQVGQ